jgi:ribonuclease-3
VQQAALREQAFTHPGAVHGSDSRRVALSYDRLEFLGDAYIELVASRFLYDALPQLGAGRLSQVREQLVSNRTLADYACAYGFDARARLAAGLHEQQQQQRLQQQQREQQHGGGSGGGAGTQVKMYADIFEAYVAAVVLDEPATGFATAEAWLLSLWRPRVLGARQSAGDGSACAVGITGHISGSASGSGDVGSAGDAGASAGGRGGSGSAGSEDPRKDEPEPKQQLAVKVMSPGCRLEYELQPRKLAKGESPQDLVHTVHVYFTGYDKWTRQLLGTGAGPNKAVAGSRAATHALEHCALLDEIVACKAAYVAAK